jgi:methylamine---glutamate N-methyltransferase subunit A
MCGIVGLFAKDPALEPGLGRLLGGMLLEMGERGPDSAGVAMYRRPVAVGHAKLVLFREGGASRAQEGGKARGRDRERDEGRKRDGDATGWAAVISGLEGAFGAMEAEERASHLVVRVPAEVEAVRSWLAGEHPSVRVMSAGERIEIYKEKGHPARVAERFRLGELEATHALGHTRMATESAVTTEHSHPFSTGLDLCLVHNGSLSNHNRLREWLGRRGVTFQTDNDSEVAAGFLTWRLSEGDSLETALEAALGALDGFYTFAVGTREGFAVLRDPIACKPAVLAETDAWVAMASEFRAIAGLPGAETARVWEPAPATVYSWSREGMR